MKHVLERIRRQCAEQARPEQQADDDFTHHAGLPQAQCQRTAEARRQQDQSQLHEREKQQVFCCMHGSGGGGCCGHQGSGICSWKQQGWQATPASGLAVFI